MTSRTAHIPGQINKCIRQYVASMARRMDFKCIPQSVAFMVSALILVHVQIMAGEEIENVFGARFGLSTLAAAGFGNLISDVIGIGTAEPVQVRATITCSVFCSLGKI